MYEKMSDDANAVLDANAVRFDRQFLPNGK